MCYLVRQFDLIKTALLLGKDEDLGTHGHSELREHGKLLCGKLALISGSMLSNLNLLESPLAF